MCIGIVMVIEDMVCLVFFFLMIRRPPRSTQSRSSAASDVYKRQGVITGNVCSFQELVESFPSLS